MQTMDTPESRRWALKVTNHCFDQRFNILLYFFLWWEVILANFTLFFCKMWMTVLVLPTSQGCCHTRVRSERLTCSPSSALQTRPR